MNRVNSKIKILLPSSLIRLLEITIIMFFYKSSSSLKISLTIFLKSKCHLANGEGSKIESLTNKMSQF